MYGRKISAFLVITAVAGFNAGFTSDKLTASDVGGVAGRQLSAPETYNLVETELNTLYKKVHLRMPASEKVQLLKRSLSSIKTARRHGPVLPVDKEIHMDFSVEALEPLADDLEFSTAKCADYKARLLIDFEPTAETRPVNPPVKRSYEIIEGICS
jgi:hypothetical protein